MAKVGVLSYSQEKDRCGQQKCNSLFSLPKATIGFQRIISDASKLHEVRYVDITDTWADFWLASVVSWYDIYNLIRAIGTTKPHARLVVGGPGMLNPWPLQDVIWAAVIGRGEGLINRVMDHDLSVCNAWYSDIPDRIITIGQATDQICSVRETEASIGCPKKCFFCEYGWKYNYKNWSGQYSEYANGETFFRDIDFGKGSATAGLDGITENERYVVNKALSSQEIVNTLARHTIRDNFRLKLFCVTSYPFTSGYNFDEWESVLDQAARVVKKPITIMLSLSHFCPMPFTPMEEERVLFFDRIQQAPKMAGKIKWMTYLQGTTVASAAYESMIFRALPSDNIRGLILGNKPCGDTANEIGNIFPHVIDGGYIPVPLISRPYDVAAGKRIYRSRVLEKYGEKAI